MGRVKVTGYLTPDDDQIDADHTTGLTEDAFLEYSDRFVELEDLEFEKED
jgi:hypothetical protein